MTAPANTPLHLPSLIGGFAAILVSGIAIGSLMLPSQGADPMVERADAPRAASAPAITAPRTRAYGCAECGVIESTREIEGPDAMIRVHTSGQIVSGGDIAGKPARNWEITIRLHDGSMHVITDANPARWKDGERVRVIAGMN